MILNLYAGVMRLIEGWVDITEGQEAGWPEMPSRPVDDAAAWTLMNGCR